MPRTKRLLPTPGALHIMCRGNNKQNIFDSMEDKHEYCLLLFDLKNENNISIFHYCLMNNHLHLIVWVEENSKISRFMMQANLAYFHYFRRKYGYCGHFWQNRFRSNLIGEDSYLLQCGKYIELNPVRANIAKMPHEYEFSSYSHYAYGREDRLITASPAYLGLADSLEERQELYRNFIVDESFVNEGWLQRLQYIGSEIFQRKMQEYFQIRNANLKRGRPRKIGK